MDTFCATVADACCDHRAGPLIRLLFGNAVGTANRRKFPDIPSLFGLAAKRHQISRSAAAGPTGRARSGRGAWKRDGGISLASQEISVENGPFIAVGRRTRRAAEEVLLLDQPGTGTTAVNGTTGMG